MRAVAIATAAVAVALLLPLEFPASEGEQEQQAAFEYEVLSGIRDDTRINYGWHDSSTGLTGGWEEGYALDLVPDYAVGKAPANAPVHAVFRYGSGPAFTAKVRIAQGRACKNMLVDLYDDEDNHLVVVEYVHIDRASNVSTATQWSLVAEDDAVTSKQIGTIAGDEKSKCKKNPVLDADGNPVLDENGAPVFRVYWSGAHLHQRVRVNGGRDVDSSRDTSLDGVGLAVLPTEV